MTELSAASECSRTCSDIQGYFVLACAPQAQLYLAYLTEAGEGNLLVSEASARDTPLTMSWCHPGSCRRAS